MIGRKKELEILWDARDSKESQFIAVYGRRRIGKTYLVRKAFDGEFAFYHTGVANVGKRDQLLRWSKSLETYGMKAKPKPRDWFMAFDLLAEGLARSPEGRKIIFLDELPWMDTPKSKFISALENFWNGWASAREDIVLIVCGSASSWILNKIINNHGGLHNRLTDRLHLEPFTLPECDMLMRERGLVLSPKQLVEAYMIFGGVPYYWTLLRRNEGLAQNVDRLCFTEGGAMTNEFEQLYASLFRHPDGHIAVVAALGTKKAGLTRESLIKATKLDDSGALTKILKELIACGFVRKYRIPGCKTKGSIYQLIDNFTLFCFRFMMDDIPRASDFWAASGMTQPVRIWCGLAFERVCLEHVGAIKRALGVSGVRCQIYAWASSSEGSADENGAQIDLVLDRDDGVINLCEMKFLSHEYVIDAEEARKLENRRDRFVRETGTRKAVHLMVVAFNGVAHNEYIETVQNVMTGEDLLR